MNLRLSLAAWMFSLALAGGAHAASVSRAPNATLGGGEPPDIELSTTSLLFGTVHLGGTAEQSFVVSNVGTGYLNASLVITGGSPQQFFLVDPLFPFSVQPGGQVEVILTFYPALIGTQQASIEVHSNDPVNPVVEVSLQGDGYEANLASLTGSPNPVLINGAMTFTVVLDAPAGPGDVSVQITTSPTALIVVPPMVTVLQGETQAQFLATAGATPGTETIYALYNTYYVTDDIEITTTVGVDAAPTGDLWLGPVAPNPVRGASRIAFALPSGAHVRIGVFDLAGRRVATLADGFFPAGRNEVPWKPEVSRSGMFLIVLESRGETRVVKAVVTP